MDKIAEMFQRRSPKASYLPSIGEELKHLMAGGSVHTQEGSRLACSLWSALTEGKL